MKARILTFCSKDLAVVERGASLTCYAASHAVKATKLDYSVTLGNRLVKTVSNAEQSQDLSARVAVDSYPISFYVSQPGDYKIAVAVGDGYSRVTDAVVVSVFNAASTTIPVATSDELRNALIQAKSIGTGHIKILLQSGSYEWPSTTDPLFPYYDMTDSPVLVTLEAAATGSVTLGSTDVYVAKTIWKGVQWSGSGILLSFRDNCTSVVSSCKFTGISRAIGIHANSATVRCDNSVFQNLTSATIGVAVVRGCFFSAVTGVVWDDVSRLIEGTAGYSMLTSPTEQTDYGCWTRVRGDAWVRFNWLTDYPKPAINTASDAPVSLCVVGNAFSTTASSGINLNRSNNSYFAHNSVEVVSGNSLSVVETRNDYFVNNWFSLLDNDSKKLRKSGWVNNATRSALADKTTLSGVDPRWSNKFLIPDFDSPLIASTQQAAIATSFGVLPATSIIGALPHIPDPDLESTLAGVVSVVEWNVSASDSFLGITSSGGTLDFTESSQSGLVRVI